MRRRGKKHTCEAKMENFFFLKNKYTHKRDGKKLTSK